MTNIMTATGYIRKHPITLELKHLGVTGKQLDAIRFNANNQGWPFDQWSFRWLEGTSFKAIPHIKPYCALKWLLLENPSSSRDKEEAWRLVNEAETAPVFEIGMRQKVAQQRRACKPRGKINDEGRTLKQIIADLALKPDHREESAKELWRHFFAELEELELNPAQIDHATSLAKCAYQYGSEGRRKRITYGRFANAVSGCRKKKSH